MGLIQSAPPGFLMEQFVPREALNSCYGRDYIKDLNRHPFIPIYWKSMIEPFMKHTIKGVIWYQGNKKTDNGFSQ